MAAKASTAAATPIAAGVKTPGRGAYSDPAQVGAMIQQMYPQYAGMDATTLGQRWIDVHTPAPAAAGGGTGAGTDVLQGPTGTTPLTSTSPNQNAPDLSGLAKFAKPLQQPKPQAPQIIISGLTGNGNGNSIYGSQLTPMTQPTQQQQKPQKQQQTPGLSTFDISKAGF